MASSINVNQNNNTVSLQDQNRKITISDNVHEKTVNITQPVTNVVNVATIGPQGPKGNTGDTGAQGPQGPIQDTGSLLTTASVTLNTSVPDDDCALINIANLASVPLLSLSILT